jgi:hypothetical protein
MVLRIKYPALDLYSATTCTQDTPKLYAQFGCSSSPIFTNIRETDGKSRTLSSESSSGFHRDHRRASPGRLVHWPSKTMFGSWRARRSSGLCY